MATIVIKDLTESKELDSEAMRAIAGGKASTSLLVKRPAEPLSFFGNSSSFSTLDSTSLFGSHFSTS